MKPLNTSEVLQVWEENLNRPILHKSLYLLSKACSNDFDLICRLSIGERDARLLQLREWMFGETLRNKAECPNCDDIVEWEATTKDFHLQSFEDTLHVRNFLLEKDGYSITFRLPDSIDVLGVIQPAPEDDLYKKILARCIISISKENEEGSMKDLPDSVWDALSDRMSEEDPQADIQVRLTCPSCKHSWKAYFDIASYLWIEINSWARRILDEVYILAKTFNWSESDILTMHPSRRQLYIEMLTA